MTLEVLLGTDAAKRLLLERQQQKTVVLVTGVFDLLHQEHLLFLKKAKAAGDFLIAGLESDVRVRAIKGEGRPIHSASQRHKNIAELEFVDVAFVLPENFSRPEDHNALLSLIKPDILAVSSHTSHQVEKKKLVEAHGGRLQIVHQFNPNISTTRLLEDQLHARA